MALYFEKDTTYETIKGPQKFGWFLGLFENLSGPNARKTELTIRDHEARRNEKIWVSITSLTQIKPPDRVQLRFAHSLPLTHMSWFISEIKLYDHWNGHDWYFRGSMAGEEIEGVYSTRTRRGFIQIYTAFFNGKLLRAQVDALSAEEGLALP